MEVEKIRFGVIGCGAVAEIGHLPAIIANPDSELAALIDRNPARLEHLSTRYRSVFTSDDYRKCFGKIDAAILALPHNLHASISEDFLKNGIHVLVDKPMALTTEECDSMIAAANQARRVLAIGLMRRCLYSARLAKYFIESGMLGRIESFNFAEGGIYNWPVTSDFFFKRRTAGGGVLLDTGAHTLDLLLWWLGEVSSYEYYDDVEAIDGVEADCLIGLTMASGAEGVVELSRTRNLRNTALIAGELADMEIDLRKNWLVIHPKNGPTICRGNLALRSEVNDLMGHKAQNAGSKIALSKDSLVGPHSIECIAEEGKNSGHTFGTRDTAVMLPAERLTEYTAHVYLKGSAGPFEHVPLQFRVGTADFKFIKSTSINLTGAWKRYSLTFTTLDDDDAVSVSVWKKDNPSPIRWLADGFQLEKGSGSGYYGPPRPPFILDAMGTEGPQSFTSLFHNQIAAFVSAVRSGSPPLVPGSEGKKAVDLIQKLYKDRKLLKFDWQDRRIFT